VAAHRGAPGADAVLGDVEIAQQLAARFDELLAQRGQREAAGGAVHQAHAEAALQGIEAAAHDDRGHPSATAAAAKLPFSVTSKKLRISV
jgi:hypothetical protein